MNLISAYIAFSDVGLRTITEGFVIFHTDGLNAISFHSLQEITWIHIQVSNLNKYTSITTPQIIEDVLLTEVEQRKCRMDRIEIRGIVRRQFWPNSHSITHYRSIHTRITYRVLSTEQISTSRLTTHDSNDWGWILTSWRPLFVGTFSGRNDWLTNKRRSFDAASAFVPFFHRLSLTHFLHPQLIIVIIKYG